MNWTCLAEFPVDRDLSELDQALKYENVGHKITEENNTQRLWIPEPAAESAAFILAEFNEQGVRFSSRASAPQHVMPDSKFGLLNFVKQVPVTLMLIGLGFLGHLAVSIPIPLLYEFSTFLPSAVDGRLIKAYAWSWQEPWRLMTPVFLHFGLAHFVLNAAAMLQIGSVLERQWGHRVYLTLCVIAGIAGNVAEGVGAATPFFGGLSGIVYGLFAFNGWLQWRKSGYAFPLPKAFYVLLIIFLVLGFTPFFSHFFGVSMANAAHLGGLVGGVVLAEVLLRLGQLPKRQYVPVRSAESNTISQSNSREARGNDK